MSYAPAATLIATPIGSVRIESEGARLTGVCFGGHAEESSDPLLIEAARQLRAYFDGHLEQFDLPLAGGTLLRAAICGIAYGRTATYGELAANTGASARAVGQACATNRFPIIVPCHRVLPTGGALGHYSGGDGPATKIWLLKHERAEGWLL